MALTNDLWFPVTIRGYIYDKHPSEPKNEVAISFTLSRYEVEEIRGRWSDLRGDRRRGCGTGSISFTLSTVIQAPFSIDREMSMVLWMDGRVAHVSGMGDDVYGIAGMVVGNDEFQKVFGGE